MGFNRQFAAPAVNGAERGNAGSRLKRPARLARAIAGIGILLFGSSVLAASSSPQAIMGFAGAEDLELMPDGHTVLVSNFWRYEGRKPGGLAVMDTRDDKPRWLPIGIQKEAGWGDPACTAPLQHIGPHGFHLSRRKDGRLELLVVNHEERQSIEFVEIVPGPAGPVGIWRGCVISPVEEFNDVTATPEGGFIASIPVEKAVRDAHGGQSVADGSVTGYLAEWEPGQGFWRLPGTDAPFNNGVELSPDGRTIYYNAWTVNEVRRYDRVTREETGRVKLDFMPDNLTVRPDGMLIAAGVTARTSPPGCPTVDGDCAQGFGAALIDPETMQATPLYHADPGVMPGTSVALQVGQSLYFGGFLGERLTKVDLGK